MKVILFIGFFCMAIPAFAGLDIFPSSLSLGPIDLNYGREDRGSLRVYNNTKEDLDLYVQRACGSEFRTFSTCHMLRAGSSCRIDVSFRPYNSGFFTCRIRVNDSSYTYSDSASVTGRAYRR